MSSVQDIRNIDDKKPIRFGYKENLLLFLSEVSIAGAKNVSNSNIHILRRSVWLAFILFGFSFAAYQIVSQTQYFFTRPVSVEFNILNKDELTFPTVTICNENIHNKSEVLTLDPSGNLSWALFKFYAPIAMDGTYSYDSRMDEILGKYPITSLPEMSGMNSLLDCQFGGQPCDTNLTIAIRTDGGNCIQFNPDGDQKTKMKGQAAGLQLVLTADKDNYLTAMSPSAGFKIFMHDYTHVVTTDVLVQAFKVDVGQHTMIKIESEEMRRLPAPYGSCSQTAGYSSSKCSLSCLENFTHELCGCGSPNYSIENITYCDSIEDYYCLVTAYITYITEKIETVRCNCPDQCVYQRFPYHVSTGKVSDIFIQWLTSVYNKRKLTPEYIIKNMAFINIYYENLEHTEIVNKPAYTLLSLLCDIGGALGLILGSTVLTFVEIAEFCILALLDSRQKEKRATKNSLELSRSVQIVDM